MGLEKLKSIFDNIQKPSTSPFGGRHGGLTPGTPSQPPHPSEHTTMMESALGTIGTNLSRYFGEGFPDFKAPSAHESSLLPGFHWSNDSKYDFGISPPAVNYFGGENSYFAKINPTIPGFTINFQSSLYNHGDSNISNSPILETQFYPFAGDFPSTTTWEEVVGNLPFGDVDGLIPANAGKYNFPDIDIEKLYDGYTFDPRQNRIGVFPVGKTDIEFLNPKNPYTGTKFDDPLIAGLDGGGLFNSSDDKYSSIFRTINKPSGFVITDPTNGDVTTVGGQILLQGNMTSTPIGSGYGSVETGLLGAYNKFGSGLNIPTTVPITNDFVQSRTISVDPTTVGPVELGKGQYVFEGGLTNLLHSHRHQIDDRLSLKKGHNILAGLGTLNPEAGGGFTFGGLRGFEPYIVSAIPLGESDNPSTEDFGGDPSSFFDNTKTFFENALSISGRKLNFGTRMFPMMRSATDLFRVAQYVSSPSGLLWVGKQAMLSRLNPRNARQYDPTSLLSGFPLGAGIKFPMRRHGALIGLFDTYENTVFEKITRNSEFVSNIPGLSDLTSAVGKTPNQEISAFATVFNKAQDTFFVGGNAFQALGFNTLGQTDITNVAPAPRGLADLPIIGGLFNRISFDSNVSERPRNFGGAKGPRKARSVSILKRHSSLKIPSLNGNLVTNPKGLSRASKLVKSEIDDQLGNISGYPMFDVISIADFNYERNVKRSLGEGGGNSLQQQLDRFMPDENPESPKKAILLANYPILGNIANSQNFIEAMDDPQDGFGKSRFKFGNARTLNTRNNFSYQNALWEWNRELGKNVVVYDHEDIPHEMNRQTTMQILYPYSKLPKSDGTNIARTYMKQLRGNLDFGDNTTNIEKYFSLTGFDNPITGVTPINRPADPNTTGDGYGSDTWVNPRALTYTTFVPHKIERPSVERPIEDAPSGQSPTTLPFNNLDKLRNFALRPYDGVDASISSDENAYEISDLYGRTVGKTGYAVVGGTQQQSMDSRVNRSSGVNRLGDFMTLVDMNFDENGIGKIGQGSGETLAEAHPSDNKRIESSQDGMPFYFKDLRDNSYIVFRAYIEALTENISPTWTPENYIGRSEPVYVYERAEREISFTLKIFAQSETELDMIYKKLNRLTSLCYPQYKEDTQFGGKTRMKPPLSRLRIGELFGNTDIASESNRQMLGFIKSVSYSYPDTSPWETIRGKRVPKHITAAINYQVIHEDVPRLGTSFYGWTGEELTVGAP